MDMSSDNENVFSIISDFTDSVSSPQEAPLTVIQDDEVVEDSEDSEDSEELFRNLIETADADKYYDSLYEEVFEDTDDEEADLGCDDNDDYYVEAALDVEETDNKKEDTADTYHDMREMVGLSADNEVVPQFCEHVACDHKDCGCCDDMRSVIGGESKSTVLPFSVSTVNVGKMSDKQVAQRALCMEITSFMVSFTGMYVTLHCYLFSSINIDYGVDSECEQMSIRLQEWGLFEWFDCSNLGKEKKRVLVKATHWGTEASQDREHSEDRP